MCTSLVGPGFMRNRILAKHWTICLQNSNQMQGGGWQAAWLGDQGNTTTGGTGWQCEAFWSDMLRRACHHTGGVPAVRRSVMEWKAGALEDRSRMLEAGRSRGYSRQKDTNEMNNSMQCMLHWETTWQRRRDTVEKVEQGPQTGWLCCVGVDFLTWRVVWYGRVFLFLGGTWCSIYGVMGMTSERLCIYLIYLSIHGVWYITKHTWLCN